MPVSVTEKATTVRAWLSVSRSALLGELEGIRKQIADDLLQSLGIGEHLPWQLRIGIDDEVQGLGFGHMPEGALDIIVQFAEAQLGDVQRDRPGFDLG